MTTDEKNELYKAYYGGQCWECTKECEHDTEGPALGRFDDAVEAYERAAIRALEKERDRYKRALAQVVYLYDHGYTFTTGARCAEAALDAVQKEASDHDA